MPDLNELLKQLSEVSFECGVAAAAGAVDEVGRLRGQRIKLVVEITSLFEQGAQVERDAIVQLVKAEAQGSTARRIIKAIEARK